MAVAEASRQAHEKLKTVGQLGSEERQVYEQIKYMAASAKDESSLPSRRDVADMLGYDTSSMSARVNALIRYGLVGEIRSAKKQASTGMTVSVLHIIDKNDRKLKDISDTEAVRWLE